MQLLGGWDFTILLQFTLSIPRNQIYILKYEFANKYTVPISILNLLIRHTLIPWFPIRCHWFKFKKFLKNSLAYPTLPVMILPVGVRTVTHLMFVFDNFSNLAQVTLSEAANMKQKCEKFSKFVAVSPII